ncbi:hypothetical protein TWF481_001194 [Arthrobotrys musiformis]|uniref:Calcineurin-like phosphoesterase domain-containing protein n=1 Tax=Arthrobotrys musiformis TaxID=47236 RepID=A0AAV9WQV5_9PEZI
MQMGYIFADLHLESKFEYATFSLNLVSPYLALLGDIGNTRDDALFTFFKRMLKQYTIVFFVPGNHEPYYSDWIDAHIKLTGFEKLANQSPEPGAGKFVYLNQTRYDLTPTVTILGCVLFSAIEPRHAKTIGNGLNDFFHIKDWTVDIHCQAHHSEVTWLKSQICEIAREEPTRSIAIFTHYCPTLDALEPKYEDSEYTSGFITDLRMEEYWRVRSVKVWAFGHTHYNYDIVEEGTGKRVVANQRGYPGDMTNGFDPGKTIEI